MVNNFTNVNKMNTRLKSLNI